VFLSVSINPFSMGSLITQIIRFRILGSKMDGTVFIVVFSVWQRCFCESFEDAPLSTEIERHILNASSP
jgi:hypothetical protein